MNFLLLTALLLAQGLGFQVYASTAETRIELAKVESDGIPGTGHLNAIFSPENELKSLDFIGLDGSEVQYTVEQLREGPQVFSSFLGRNVTFLYLDPDFNPGTGGHGVLKFLKNGAGATDEFLNFRFLMYLKDGQWIVKSTPNALDPDSDENPYTDDFNYLFLKKRSLFGTMIGVARILPKLL